mmetsp:Transcript_10951/g.14256  ORF Transcript_10951/g.14256 Transcript_10951/m.14256 type:complete len:118 (+) Transcript_10951:3-356(+)
MREAIKNVLVEQNGVEEIARSRDAMASKIRGHYLKQRKDGLRKNISRLESRIETLEQVLSDSSEVLNRSSFKLKRENDDTPVDPNENTAREQFKDTQEAYTGFPGTKKKKKKKKKKR